MKKMVSNSKVLKLNRNRQSAGVMFWYNNKMVNNSNRKLRIIVFAPQKKIINILDRWENKFRHRLLRGRRSSGNLLTSHAVFKYTQVPFKAGIIFSQQDTLPIKLSCHFRYVLKLNMHVVPTKSIIKKHIVDDNFDQNVDVPFIM